MTQTLHNRKLKMSVQGLGVGYVRFPSLNVMWTRDECHVPCILVNCHVIDLQKCKPVVFFILFGKLPSFFFILVFGEVCSMGGLLALKVWDQYLKAYGAKANSTNFGWRNNEIALYSIR